MLKDLSGSDIYRWAQNRDSPNPTLENWQLNYVGKAEIHQALQYLYSL